MREDYFGAAVSVATHLCFILPLMFVSVAVPNNPVKTVEIDLSFINTCFAAKGSSEGTPAKAVKRTLHKSEKDPEARKTPVAAVVKPNRHDRQASKKVAILQQAEPSPAPPVFTTPEPAKEQTVLIAPEPVLSVSDIQSDAGEAETFQTFAEQTAEGGSSLALNGSTVGTGDTQDGVAAAGEGDEIMFAEGEDYGYIRRAVMKNIGYPERARRMGYEGRTLLSFVVQEDGTTTQIKVLKSSGFRLLDDSAKEGVARTVIPRDVPRKVAVHLPITYALRDSNDDT
jgi:protein TonB